MTAPYYPDLWLGPEVDGEPTWYGTFDDIPKDWEYRASTDRPWASAERPDGYWPPMIVQARPVQQSDPNGVSIDMWLLAVSTVGDHIILVTTVGEMRDRTDLDQWEYACAAAGWCSINSGGTTRMSDDHPIIVRRKT